MGRRNGISRKTKKGSEVIRRRKSDMERKFVFSIILLLILLCNDLPAYENKLTHPDMTQIAAEYSHLNNYLVDNIGLNNGLKTRIPSNGTNSILDLLRKGSTDEDIPICRSSNHFHNPLKSWDQSYMSDAPWFINEYCSSWQPIYSNITWGTGYLSPVGTKFTRPRQWMGWGDARDYYYWALTATSNTYRETYLASTFQALGQVSHLLQDMAVPAHVRNDFTSHLSFIGFISWNPIDWFGSLYEDYVKNNPGIVASASPKPISLTNPRLTDFWDTDRYRGDNPSASPLGLAEFTNANYFSDTTIINNRPSGEHYFNYPVVNSQNSQICEDYVLGKNTIRKYVSRKDRGECPPVTEERKADHYAAVSILQSGIPVANENLHLLRLWLDKNVHDTYARDLVPQAVGYSAALLDYFFRGNIQGVAVPIFFQGDLSFMKLKIKNMTPDETMRNGNLMLTYRYRPPGGADDGSQDIFEQAWGLDGSAVIPCTELNGATKKADGTIEGGGETIVDFLIYPPLPKKDYNSIRFLLAFRGTLGNEDGAVIGKSFIPGDVVFNEEWDKYQDAQQTLPGNYPWGHTELNILDWNPDNGSTVNVIVGGTTLVKDNIRVSGQRTARVNESFVDTLYNNGQFKPQIFPILVTPNTYVMFKIDAMSINAIPNAPSGQTRQYQGLWLYFDHGLILEFSMEGQNVYYNENTGIFDFYLGENMLDNIYELFGRSGIAIPEGPFYLQGINFVQQLWELDVNDPANIEYHQHMEVDFIQIIEGKEQ
jgi:hypothetical protein